MKKQNQNQNQNSGCSGIIIIFLLFAFMGSCFGDDSSSSSLECEACHKTFTNSD